MSETAQNIIRDEELIEAFGNANFGSISKRDVVKFGLLKCVCGYYQGHTSTQIITELGLINKEYEITAKGRQYLWLAFEAQGTI